MPQDVNWPTIILSQSVVLGAILLFIVFVILLFLLVRRLLQKSTATHQQLNDIEKKVDIIIEKIEQDKM